MTGLEPILAEIAAAPAAVGAAVALGLVGLVWIAARLVGGGRARRLEAALTALSAAQERSAGALGQVAEMAARGQAETLRSVEARLDAVGVRLGDGLADAIGRTSQGLGALAERLEAIDRAQANLERLSGDVLGLQAILADKQTRGAFGEIQLVELLRAALPPSAFALQPTLSTGRRPDALLLLPHPPGPIAVDAKFPLESYEALVAAGRGPEREAAARTFARALRGHAKAIAERYLVPGETADAALMFLPSEAVYAELHAHHGAVVREGFALGVYVVSPTTLMATLHTMRAVLKDAQLRAEAGALRQALAALGGDLDRLRGLGGALRERFGKIEGDVAAIERAAETAQRRLRGVIDAPTSTAETATPRLAAERWPDADSAA